MKPKEFDDLVRQKFDQNDFAYNPAHWDQLAERLEGGSKKRNIIMWWWAPVVGMAASVALAFGVSTVLRMSNPATNDGISMAHVGSTSANTNNKQQHAQLAAVPYTPSTVQDINTIHSDKTAQDNYSNKKPVANRNGRNADVRNRTALNSKPVRRTGDNDEDGFTINLNNAVGQTIVLNANKTTAVKKADDEVKKVAMNEPMNTFIGDEPDQPKKQRRLSVILSGGYNRGSQNTGYMAGATVRKMVNDKVYIEGDVAFASSNNTQVTSYAEAQNVPVAKNTGRNSSRTSKELGSAAPNAASIEVIRQKNISYDLYYAQITPSIGYNVMKRMSIAVGPDFQRMLVDNRPAPSTVERGTIQVAPVFDVGFIGKTELGITKKMKAAVYYRKGVNNVITPMGRFIDRDYLQFQVKYTILNK